MKKLLFILTLAFFYSCKSEKISGFYSNANHNVYIEQINDSMIKVSIETWYGNVDTMTLKIDKVHGNLLK